MEVLNSSAVSYDLPKYLKMPCAMDMTLAMQSKIMSL